MTNVIEFDPYLKAKQEILNHTMQIVLKIRIETEMKKMEDSDKPVLEIVGDAIDDEMFDQS